jgi:uncharacterized protein
MENGSLRPLAVVTGASSGIGFELARQFALNGFDLIIAAEDDELSEAAYALHADPVQVDLATEAGVETLYTRIKETGRPIAAIALNAGIGAGGPFVDTDLDDELKLIDLNIRSTVHLAKYVVRDMVEQNEGRILFTSFIQSFALALRNELKETDVTVTSLMPGPTDTEFFERAGMEDTRVGSGSKDDPEEVARDGFQALMAGEERVVSASLSTKAQGHGSRLMPDKVKAEMHRRMAEPGSGDDDSEG